MEMIPERQSLVDQTTKIIREMIQSGEWDAHLPTESQLRDRMQVGRNTVRASLAVLTREGWISEGRPGLRREILRREEGGAHRSQTRCVAFLAPDALERARSQVILTVGGLRDHLAELGYRLEIHTSKAFRLQHPERTLEALVRKSPADLWVLHLATREIQAWFAKKGIPALVYGSTHEGVELPCVDIDYVATVRHAVGSLLGKGHSHLALMLPTQRLYGNTQGENAFIDAVQCEHHPSRQATVLHIAEDNSQAVRKELKRAMQRKNPPTGLILWRAPYAISVFSYAHELGIRIPHDLSAICVDDSSTMDWLVPPLARYRVQQSVIIGKLFRQIHKILTSGPVTVSQELILPDWSPAGSVAPPPNSRSSDPP